MTTQTKERPILFSGEMVRAILEGRKTQTRRVLKPQPLDVIPFKGDRAGRQWVALTQRDPNKGLVFKSRYGQPGDRLWVRETWREVNRCGGNPPCTLVRYEADNVEQWREGLILPFNWAKQTRLRPSIHMPRWASRITLEIVDVRVERVQDISGEDCITEGIDALYEPDTNIPADHYNRQSYATLWDSINAKRGYCWDKNPWVWVIEFKLVQS